MPMPPNTRVGRYEIRSFLGKGGMGEVYLAHDTNLKRLVAIKFLPSEFTGDPTRLRRFQREAYAASSLNHPNILTIFEIGEADGYRFIAAEYVAGESLRQHMSWKRIELRESLDIAIQVASALAAAEHEGIVHRDIKPENIMLRSDNYVKVLDFGLAKLNDSKAPGPPDQVDREASTFTMTQTTPGMVMGTISYMSPEQARGRDIDTRSDIWSLGVVLYEMITGNAPFKGESSNDVVAAILKTEPPPMTEFTPELPGEVVVVVDKMLRKNLEERYQNSHDLLVELEQLRRDLDFANKLDHPMPPGLPRKSGLALNGNGHTPVGQNDETVKIRKSVTHQTFFSEFLIDRIKRHKFLASLLLVSFIAGLITLAYFYSKYPGTQVITSIAVLPFVNGSGDDTLDYLSDGLSESLIDHLSQLPQLKVIARSSSFKFRGTDTDPKEVAANLGVQALVIGRLGKRGDDLQVRVELVDGRDKTQMWGEQYNGKADEMQTIQAEISKQLSEKLRPAASGGDPAQKPSPNNDEAYQLYLKGRYSWNKLTQNDLKKSIEYFNQAIEKSPNYALAYAGLANSYIVLGANDLPAADTYPKAEAATKKALQLADTLPDAHYAMAATKFYYYRNLQEAEKELNRALALNPNYAMAFILQSNISLARGQTNEAISQIKKALDLDPYSLLFNNKLSTAYYFARDYNAALEQAKKTFKLDSQAWFLHSDMCMFYAQLGRYNEALASCQKAIILEKDDPPSLSNLGVTYALSGKQSEADWVLSTLSQVAARKYIPAYYFASVYAALGDRTQALIWLNKAKEDHSFLMFLGVDPVFDKIKTDPRYTALLTSIHTPE